MCRVVKHIIFLLIFFAPVLLHSQNNGTKIFSITEEGKLPKITALCQIKNGYILAGTTNGLYRFDGINFYKYPQEKDVPSEVTTIYEASNGLIWIGFNSGAIGFLQNNKLILQHAEEGHPAVAIQKIAEDNAGVIWFATAGEGIYYFTNKRYYNINTDDGLSDDFVYSLVYKQGKGILAGTDKGINICNVVNGKKIIHVYTSKNGLPDNIVRNITVANKNYCWIAMQDGGIGSYSPEGDSCKAYGLQKSWTFGQVNDLITTEHEVWAASEDEGLLCFNNSNGVLENIIIHDVSVRKISCLLQDNEGNIWAASDEKLIRTPGSRLLPVYTFQSASFEDLHTMLAAKDGSLWFNKNEKLIHVSKDENNIQTEKSFNVPSLTSESDITCIYEDYKGYIWLGTMGNGVIIFDPNKNIFRKITEDSLLANGSVLSVSGKNGIVWIASLEGVAALNISGSDYTINKKISFTNYNDESNIGSKYVYDILTDSKNNIWFATDGKGITLKRNNEFVHYNRQTGLQTNVIYKIVEDSAGNKWLSSLNNGVIKFDGKKFTGYSTTQGISDLNITTLSLSGNDLLVANKSGIDILNTKNGAISYINAEQGIDNINIDPNSFAKDANGNVYFANDFTIYKYQSNTFARQQPSLVIDEVRLFLDSIVTEKNIFSANENNISFYFTGLFYSHPEKIQYQYKLQGFEETWTSTKDRIKNFPKLPPGTYIFRVRASLSKNFAGAPEASFTFTILQPFYKSWWFITLCIMLLGGSLYLFIKSRDERHKKYNSLEKEKIQSQLETLRSQINPHFLFNSFNTLISEIESHPENAVTYVEHLSDFYRNIVVNREKDLITLKEELAILNDYFFIQQKRYGKALNINIDVAPQQAKENLITPLALQLLIENAIKHNMVSLETPLYISLSLDDKNYLVIKNNINKKLQQEKGSSLGLQNISKRYEILSKMPVIVENNEKEFIVKIPLIHQQA